MFELIADDGVVLSYVTDGDGPVAVIYLHGMGGAAAHWKGLWDCMPSDRYRHLAFDLRGHGGSGRLPCEITNERLSRDVLAVADDLGLRRFSVVGHSMGGKVGMRLAAMAPDRVVSLALLGSPGPGIVPFRREDIAGFMATYHDVAVTTSFYRPWFKVWSTPTIDAWMRSFAALPDWALHAAAEMAVWTDITPEVRHLKLPILALAGDEDPVYGPAYQRDSVLSVFSHADLVTVPDCGHGLILERPVEIARILDDFLAR